MVPFHTMSTKKTITKDEFNLIIDMAVKIYRRPDCTDHALQDIIKIGAEEFFND